MANTRLLLFILSIVAVSHLATAQCPAVRKCLRGDTCSVLPIPPAILPPSPVGNAEGYTLTKIRPSVYTFVAANYRALILYKKGNGRLTVVDFPEFGFRDENYLLTAATMRLLNGNRPSRLDMVYSHRHIDHIGGAGFFYADMMHNFPGLTTFVWGTRETKQFLARIKGSTIPKINVFVSKRGRTVNLAESLNLKLTIVGGHTLSDLLCHVLPSVDGEGIAHLPDFVAGGSAPFYRFGETIDLGKYITVLKDLLNADFKLFSGGHGALMKKPEIRLNLQYTEDTIQFIREAAAEVTLQQFEAAGIDRFVDPTAVEFLNGGWAFDVTLKVQVDICVRKLIKKYGCILGSVAVFSPSHCNSAYFYELISV